MEKVKYTKAAWLTRAYSDNRVADAIYGEKYKLNFNKADNGTCRVMIKANLE